MKIAIVDNMDNSLSMLKKRLLDIPKVLDVILVDNEMDALNLVREDFDLFILNTSIEGIDTQFINYCIKKYNKVIVYTDNQDINLIEKANSLKIIDYIIKSSTHDILIDTIKRVIDNEMHTVLLYSNDIKSKTQIIAHIESQNINLIEYKSIDLVVENLTNNKFDVILFDFDEISLEYIEKIRKIRESYTKESLPIILFSYFDKNKNIVANFLKVGANFVIYKPYLKEELINLLNENIDKNKICKLIDETNGLYKLDFFKESGKKIIQNAIRENIPISIAIIEIDNLKEIIYRYRVNVFELIRHLGNILINSLRTSDLICNYYDNKIAILMTNTESKNAYRVIDRVRKKIKHLPFILNNDEILNYTISGGVAGSCEYDLNIMLDMADEYLYRTKKFGMDKIEIISER